jgi:hypothetical protein
VHEYGNEVKLSFRLHFGVKLCFGTELCMNRLILFVILLSEENKTYEAERVIAGSN